MADEIKNDTIDTFKEHWCHQSYHNDCSECYKEARAIRAWKTVNHPIDNLSAITGIKLSDMLGK